MTKKKRFQMQGQKTNFKPPKKAFKQPKVFEHPEYGGARYQALVEKYREGTPKEGDVDPSGTEDEFEARLFHGWLNGRDIPIDELALLFNRDEATIKRWLAMGGK